MSTSRSSRRDVTQPDPPRASFVCGNAEDREERRMNGATMKLMKQATGRDRETGRVVKQLAECTNRGAL